MTPEPSTPLERAQHIALLMGGNGLSQNRQVALIAAKLEEWSRTDTEALRAIAPKRVKGPDGAEWVWRCPDHLIPVDESAVTPPPVFPK